MLKKYNGIIHLYKNECLKMITQHDGVIMKCIQCIYIVGAIILLL